MAIILRLQVFCIWKNFPQSYYFSFEGSLLNLAKHAASTVQILGAEKALFRALKSRRDTPKYGLIYHASLVGQTSPKHKGKVSYNFPGAGLFFLQMILILFWWSVNLCCFFFIK